MHISKKYISIFIFFAALCGLCIDADAAEGDYIVLLRQSAAEEFPSGGVQTFAETGAEIKPLTDDGLCYTAKSKEDIYAHFGADNIAIVCPDATFTLFDYPQTTNDTNYSSQDWEFTMTNSVKARSACYRGNGVRVAVIDSGIAAGVTDLDYTRIEEGYNCVTNVAGNTTDTLGHGTKVATIIAGMINNGVKIAGFADKVTIVPLKVTDASSFSLSYVITALQKAKEYNCDVVNMSLGSYLGDNADTLALCKTYIDELEASGALLVAAAGNDGKKYTGDCPYEYPASYDNVISVSSLDSAGNIAASSQRNDKVCVCAPGVSVSCLTLSGIYTTASGTSFSSPIVAAAAAIAKEIYPTVNMTNFREILEETAFDYGDPGYDNSYGHGCLNTGGMMTALGVPTAIISRSGSADEGYTVQYSMVQYFLRLNSRPLKFISVFEKSGKITEVHINTVSSDSLGFEVTGGKGADTLKLYIWDENMKSIEAVMSRSLS